MSTKVSELSIIKQQLRNEKTKYSNSIKRRDTLKNEKKILQNEKEKINNELKKVKKKNKQLLFEQEIDKQTIEEYKRIIFHWKAKKNSKNTDEKDDSENYNWNEENWSKKNKDWIKKNKKRDKGSYTKPTPKESEVKQTLNYKIENCKYCWKSLENIAKYSRYIEDMNSTFISSNTNKEIIKEIIESGYCSDCRKQTSAKTISKKDVTFGDNIKMFINFQVTILKHSYSTVQKFLQIMYGIEISTWEISNILEQEATILTDEYEEIRKRISQQKWVHFDETGWNVQQNEANSHYCWWATWIETNDVLYDLWCSRAWWEVKWLIQSIEQNNQEKKDKNYLEKKITQFVWISDNYWAYTNKFEFHQLCWAHPQRKLRDLSESNSLWEKKQKRALVTYTKFSRLYRNLRNEISKEERRIQCWKGLNAEQLEDTKNQLSKRLKIITKVHKDDPQKLITYKNSLNRYSEKYFVCILKPWIPADNNKAERILRHIVLKRKNCNGSITIKSAKYMSINYSVLLSLYWKDSSEFFVHYKNIRDSYFINLKNLNKKKA